MTTRAISHPLPPPPDEGGVLGGVKGSLGFAMKRVLLGMKSFNQQPSTRNPELGFTRAGGKR
ncbi:hypothetical protein MPLB_690022 [Mesorhizobium sp. ORS 3324]|nr:hypothetical protein MPLB_690022 [Mesorhizobium sp. ORS 3324]